MNKVLLLLVLLIVNATAAENVVQLEAGMNKKERVALHLSRARMPELTRYSSKWFTITRTEAVSISTGERVRCAVVRLRSDGSVYKTILFKPFQATVLEYWNPGK
jgi:hypothetical protein